MANVNNDDEIEIHNLPEVSTLQAGMMVAVDSQPTGTKCFNLSTALESKANTSDLSTKADKSTVTMLSNELANKVDLPVATPVKGQVLQFNGTANEWNRLITGTRFNSAVYPEQAINVKFNTTCYGNPSDHDSNSEVTSVQGVMTSADGQSTVNIEGMLLPFNLGSGYLHSWTNARGTHLDWSSINEVPSSTSTDSGKALIVDSNGDPAWTTVNTVPSSTESDSGKVLSVDSNGNAGWSTVGSPVTLSRHWEKANGDYNDNTQQLDFDVSTSGIKSAVVVIQMSLNTGKYVLFNMAGIDMYNNEFDVRENYIQNNSDFNGIKPSATTIIPYNASGIKSIRIKYHGSQQHKFSTEASGIDMLVMGYK